MDIVALFQRKCGVSVQKLLLIVVAAVGTVLVLQCFGLTNRNLLSPLPPNKNSIATSARAVAILDISNLSVATHAYDSDSEEKRKVKVLNTDGVGYNDSLKNETLISGDEKSSESSSMPRNVVEMRFEGSEKGRNRDKIKSKGAEINFSSITRVILSQNSTKSIKIQDPNETEDEYHKPLLNVASSITFPKSWRLEPISIPAMNSLYLRRLASPHTPRPKWSSARDRELLAAKLEIIRAPYVKNVPGLDTSIFRNVSVFKRSYELMERVLKVYIYKEGEKPIFHTPHMRGIYASEGWFMKLMEGNKKFVVKDPKKANLFYLPLSAQKLRDGVGRDFRDMKDLQNYVERYVATIAGRYKFWNRTGGADHFLVGCHDWAGKLTKKHMKNSIRSLCNANVAQTFEIGKDTTLPVTYIRSSVSPIENIGGKPPLERHTLAFFAGSMHGYLRPILLHYWEDKIPDMKIVGPMKRDVEGKKQYREYMKSSKYCICAKGYEVHTPRLVEALLHECVPVIIADNYVPPFFEVLDWEAFAVFVKEKDIPNLRSILLSIPEETYLAMQGKVKMVQKHFFWHKKPLKYDLFHMILHSVWHNRVFNVKGPR